MQVQTPLQKYKNKQKVKFQAYIERHIDNPNLCWRWVSRVPLLDLTFLRKWRTQPWSWQYLSCNPCFSKSDKLSTKDEFPWSWWSTKDMTTMEDYLSVDDGTCGFYNFSLINENIVLDVEKYPQFEWNWVAISLNPHISEKFVFKYKDQLDFNFVAENKAISIKFLYHTKSKFNWDSTHIARNPNLNDENFFLFFGKRSFKNSERANNLSENEGISIDFILSHPEFAWNKELVNYRSDITKEHILQYPNFDWRWGILSSCANIDKHFLLNHPRTILSEFYMYNSALTIDEVEHLPPNEICCNLLLGTTDDKVNFLKKFYAVRIIGNAFFNCYWHYEFAYCKARLNKRYDELFGTELMT